MLNSTIKRTYYFFVVLILPNFQMRMYHFWLFCEGALNSFWTDMEAIWSSLIIISECINLTLWSMERGNNNKR